MNDPITYGEIEDAEQALRWKREAYLRRWGWAVTCSTPGSYWLWRRDFADVDLKARQWWEITKARVEAEGRQPPSEPTPYGVITVPLELAVSMTVRCLDEQPERAEGDDDE